MQCRSALRVVAPAFVDGVSVRSAFEHAGPAAALVHRLKYDGLRSAAGLLARALVPIVPADAACFVPIPRVRARRWRYGLDPAVVLAVELAALLGRPIAEVLVAPLWQSPHAGKPKHQRRVVHFKARSSAPVGAVLIDDVCTTGATARAAMAALGQSLRVVTATRALGTSLSVPASHQS